MHDLFIIIYLGGLTCAGLFLNRSIRSDAIKRHESERQTYLDEQLEDKELADELANAWRNYLVHQQATDAALKDRSSSYDRQREVPKSGPPNYADKIVDLESRRASSKWGQ